MRGRLDFPERGWACGETLNFKLQTPRKMELSAFLMRLNRLIQTYEKDPDVGFEYGFDGIM